MLACCLCFILPYSKLNGKVSCTQVKCSWNLPAYVREVEYARVRDTNFTSARKMKADLDARLDSLSEMAEVDSHG